MRLAFVLLSVSFLSPPVRADIARSAPLYPPATCLSAPYDSATTPQQHALRALIRTLTPVLAEFSSLKAALSARQPDICLADSLVTAQGFLSDDDNRIVLNSALAPTMQLAVLLHELRHLDQMVTGTCPSPDLAMDQTARATFALEADASAVSLLIAWKLRQDGAPEVWDAFLTWPNAGDIAARFERVMAATGDPGLAAAAAFEQWYASDWRREAYYIAACSDYLDRLDRSKALPRYQLMPEGYLTQLCHLPDGRPYACVEPSGALAR